MQRATRGQAVRSPRLEHVWLEVLADLRRAEDRLPEIKTIKPFADRSKRNRLRRPVEARAVLCFASLLGTHRRVQGVGLAFV
jgi:hypothetical protein